MSTRARAIPDLPAVTTLSNSDLVIVEVVVGSNTTTSKMTGTNLRKAMVRGPYANDSASATGGVIVGQMYYTATGDVKVRLV